MVAHEVLHRGIWVRFPVSGFWLGECGSVTDLYKESLVGWSGQ